MSHLCKRVCFLITKLLHLFFSHVDLVCEKMFKEEEEVLQQNPDHDSAGGSVVIPNDYLFHTRSGHFDIKVNYIHAPVCE